MLTIRIFRNDMDGKECLRENVIPWGGHSLSVLSPRDALNRPVAAAALVTLGEMQTVYRAQDFWHAPEDGSTVDFILTEGGGDGLLAIAFWPITLPIYAWRKVTGFFKAPSSSGVGTPELGTSSEKETSTYGFGGITNQTAIGATIPVVYGQHLVGGQVLQIWNEATGDNLGEMLYMLIGLSEGPIEQVGISGVTYDTDQDNLSTTAALPDNCLLNGLDIKSLRDIRMSIRLGSDTQTVIPDFRNVTTAYAQQFSLQSAGNGRPTLNWTTRDAVDAVAVNLVCPQGLFRTSESGIQSQSVRVRLRVVTLDGMTTVHNQTSTLGAAIRSPVYFTLRADNLPVARYQVLVDRVG